MPQNKFNIIEVVNRKYLNPRNIIAAFTEKLAHQFGGPVTDGIPIDITGGLDPTGSSGEDVGFSVTPEPQAASEFTTDDIGAVVEETLTLSGTSYMTSLPVQFFRNVWYDGLLANYAEHYILSGTYTLVPTATLLSGTEVIGQYVVGYE